MSSCAHNTAYLHVESSQRNHYQDPRFFRLTEMDLEAARMLTNANLYPPVLYHFQQAYDQNPISNESVYRFVRGESSEYVITKLANIGISQVKIMNNGIIARPDILQNNEAISPDNFLVVELKDNATLGKRLEPSDSIFKGYLHQLLYYLVLADVPNGILCIKYSVPELIWYERDNDGDHYLKPLNGKKPGIESWLVHLSLDDPLRKEIKEEMIRRRNSFLEALIDNRVEVLPRLTGAEKRIKCKWCSFGERCWNSDGETVGAMKLALQSNTFVKILDAYDIDD